MSTSTDSPSTARPRSVAVTEGIHASAARGMLRGLGFSDEDLTKRKKRAEAVVRAVSERCRPRPSSAPEATRWPPTACG